MKCVAVVLTVLGGVLPVGAALGAFRRARAGRGRLQVLRTEWEGLREDQRRAERSYDALGAYGNPATFDERKVTPDRVEQARKIAGDWQAAQRALDGPEFPKGPTMAELQMLWVDADLTRFADTIDAFKVEGIVALVGIVCATVGSVMGFYL